MTAQKQSDQTTAKSVPTGQAERRPWKKKTPIEVVLEQIDKLRDDVNKREEALKKDRRQLQKLEEVLKTLETP